METLLSITANNEYLRTAAAFWWGYVPLGAVGIWRWSVWCSKKVIALFYRVPKGSYAASLSVVVPVYNEDPEMFRRALMSWRANDPDEIIAVIDYMDTDCQEVFKRFQVCCPCARMIITHTPGKRAALAEGIRASSCEIIALTDSDTLWMIGFKERALGPFSDPRVGGVAPRQDVLRADTLARKLFRIHIFNRYASDFAYQAAFGQALSCISGRTGLYRRDAIVFLTEELEHEYFLGKRCISGDDKRLTSLVQRDGWRVKYMRDALVYTPGSVDMATYTKQQIRWTRNSWRSDMQSVFALWMWKNPFLLFHTIDRFVQPFTLLLGPMFFIVALYRGDWTIATILFCWWMISRAIKVLPHLIDHPRDMLIIPAHVAYTFFLAIIKIYTLVTVGEQGWITRWHARRMQRVGALKNAFAYATTMCVVASLFMFSYTTNNHAYSRADFLQRKALAAQEKEQRRLLKVDGGSQLTELADDHEAQQRLDLLSAKVDADSFGYYRVKWGETQDDVRRRFFLSPNAPIFTENGAAIGSGTRLRFNQRIAIAVNDLRDPHVAYYRTRSRSGFYLQRNYKQDAIMVRGRGSFVTIPELAAKINNKSIIEDLGNKQFIIRKNIFVDDGVTLIIDGTDVGWLKLRSGRTGFAWLKAENGNLVMRNTKITSWDEERGDYDMGYEDGRSYVLQKSSGRMDISGSELAYLGYYGSPRRGNPFGGPYGVSWKVMSGAFRNELSTGVMDRSRIHHNLFGIYTYGATGAIFSGNEVSDNIQYGFDPHDDSNHLLIEGNMVFRNGNHGIILSKRCFSNVIRGNFSESNRLHGIMLDRDSRNNLVVGNYVAGNTNGIALYRSYENIVVYNSVNHNGFGIRMNDQSGNNFFGNNTIESNRKGIYMYQGSLDNDIFRNAFARNGLDVHMKEASRAFLVRDPAALPKSP